jgi:hypothetical protein
MGLKGAKGKMDNFSLRVFPDRTDGNSQFKKKGKT